jgi:hypothetical protein
MSRVTNKARHAKNVATGKKPRRNHNRGAKKHHATGTATTIAAKPKHGVKRVIGGVRHLLHKITHPRSHRRH